MKRPSPQAGGFTLIELLVAAAIMILAVAAASMALINQYRGLQSSDLTRLANGEDRAAIQSVEHSLRVLGWGIDPRYAIDLKYPGYKRPCDGTSTCRDRTDGPDDLVFVARDPLYNWTNYNEVEPSGATCNDTRGCFASNGSAWFASTDNTGAITVTLPNGYVLKKGQTVMVACSEGVNAVMLTLSAKYTGTGSSQTLQADNTEELPYNDLNSVVACHAQSGAAMFLVNRYHYFIEGLATDGTQCTAFSSTCVPWLMLDTGVDLDEDGNLPLDYSTGDVSDQDDLIPVAKNVEDMQVAYILNSVNVPSGSTAPDSNADWVLGNDRTAAAEEPDFTATAPSYTDSSTSPSRFTANPANVRGVRVSLRLRSDHPDRAHTDYWAGDALPYAENRTGTVQLTGYRQYTAETQIYTRNLESRLAFFF